MVVLATDNFNRANDSTGLGVNWTDGDPNSSGGTSHFTISNNTAVPNDLSNLDSCSYYTAIAWQNDQYSKDQITESGSSVTGPGVAARCSGNASTFKGYFLVGNHTVGNNLLMDKFVNGTFTSLGNGTQAFTNGDPIELDIQGARFTAKMSGITVTALGQTDSSITSGSPGIYNSTAATTAIVDNWEAGNFVSGQFAMGRSGGG